MIRDNTLYKALPTEYQQVEYLRSTDDNEYINTGYYADGNKSVMEVDFQPLISSSSAQKIISGAYRSARFYVSVNTNSKITFGLGDGYNNTIDIDTNRHVAIIDAYNLTATFDGVSYPANNGSYSHFTNTNNWIGIMGGQGSNSTTMQYIKMKFYEMKLYEWEEVIQERDGSSYTTIQKTLIHHYIPCLRKSDNKTGVYDLVDDVFKASTNGNSQYGDFIFPETSEVNSNGRMYVGKEQYWYSGVGTPGIAKEIQEVYAGISNPTLHNLPYAYQEVEYLQTDGTAYIDTGVYPNNHLHVNGVFDNFEVTGSNDASVPLFGCESNDIYYEVYYGRQPLISTNSTSTSFRFYYRNEEKSITFSANYAPTTGVIDMNGMIFSVTLSPGVRSNSASATYDIDFTIDKTLYLFASNTSKVHIVGDEIVRQANLMLYSFQISDNDTLIRDFIPCYRKSDNEPGLYDTVNNVFYSNAADSGTFTVGADIPTGIAKKIKKVYAGDAYGVARLVYHAPILPSAYQQVEYLESTGTQRINTATTAATTLALSTDFQVTDLTPIGSEQYPYIAGVYKTSKKRFHISMNYDVDDIVLGIGAGFAHSGDTNLNRHLAVINIGQLTAYLDGLKILATSTSSDYTKAADGTIQLFCSQGSATTTIHYSNVKMYNAKIGYMDSNGLWTNVLQDFYPCYRKSDGEPGMYDIINNIFYTNAGTGTFLYGNRYVKEL